MGAAGCVALLTRKYKTKKSPQGGGGSGRNIGYRGSFTRVGTWRAVTHLEQANMMHPYFFRGSFHIGRGGGVRSSSPHDGVGG